MSVKVKRGDFNRSSGGNRSSINRSSVRRMSQKMIRRPDMTEDVENTSQLKRTLTTFHLTMLGVGSTLGAGIYIIAGMVAFNDAGPATIVSFLLAAIASLLAGFFYAEFGARVPKSGSAYTYIYTSIGELCGFILGWTMIMQYVIGSASVAKSMSQYFDAAILGGAMGSLGRTHMSLNIPLLAPYPDFIAFTVITLLTLLLWYGVQESTRINNVLTIVNICVISFIILFGVYGFTEIGLDNWQLPSASSVNSTTLRGDGGFAPFGLSGIISGASICFYAFIGFDVIATTGEEAKNPHRAIPISTILCIAICTLAYGGVSAAVTILLPYDKIDKNAPIPQIFTSLYWDMPWAGKLISIGAISALTTSLMGSLFPMPRIIYSMATDGLLYDVFSRVGSRKTPTAATWVSGMLAAVLAAIIDLESLVDMMSIGTLLSYSMVALSVLVLRYRGKAPCPAYAKSGHVKDDQLSGVSVGEVARRALCCQPMGTQCSKSSERLASWLIAILTLECFVSAGVCAKTNFVDPEIVESATWRMVTLVVLAASAASTLLCLLILARIPQQKAKLRFMVWGVPFLPVLTCWLNLIFMFQLPLKIWVYFLVWLVLGCVIYFTYGVSHSLLEKSEEEEDEVPKANSSSDKQPLATTFQVETQLNGAANIDQSHS
jgi:amino acid transporter